MSIESLDPRVSRLNIEYDNSDFKPLEGMSDLETYQVFVRLKESRPLLHVGIVHAPNLEIAFMNAKEQYSRRLTCTDLWIVETRNVAHSKMANVGQSAYELIDEASNIDGDLEYEVFHLLKRGGQPKHVGTIKASGEIEAFSVAKNSFDDLPNAVHVWIAKSAHILKSKEEDIEIWDMLSEKRYRDAGVYKVKDRIEKFKAENK